VTARATLDCAFGSSNFSIFVVFEKNDLLRLNYLEIQILEFQIFHLPPVTFGGAATAGVALLKGLGLVRRDSGARFRRREVFIKRGGFRSRTATRRDGQDFDDANIIGFRKSQHMARADLAMRFRHWLTIKTQSPARHQPLSITASFEEPRRPKPFVNAHFRRW